MTHTQKHKAIYLALPMEKSRSRKGKERKKKEKKEEAIATSYDGG